MKLGEANQLRRVGKAFTSPDQLSVVDIAAFTSAIVITLIALLFSVSGGEIVGPASNWIVALLALSGIFIAFLSVRLWRRIRDLRRAGEDAQTGAKLHLRFVVLFSLTALVPAIVIALFSGLTIGQGLQAWFSTQVRGAIESSLTIGKTAYEKANEATKIDVVAMAEDLNAAGAQFRLNPKTYNEYLALQAGRRGFVAVYVLNQQGKVLAMAQRPNDVPAFVQPSAAAFATAQAGDVHLNIDSMAVHRALYRLNAFSNSYLSVVRVPEAGQLEDLKRVASASSAYKLIEQRQGMLQLLFALAYSEIVLLVLIGAAWIGLVSAGRISGPIGLLAETAERVRLGDMAARVPTIQGGDEISGLAETFNRMTGELQFQRIALEEATEQAETRLAFIGAVLEGVSAGVVSLDASMTIRAANSSVSRFLQVSADELEGVDFSTIAPEFMAVISKAKPNIPASGQAERLVNANTVLFDVRAAFAGDDLVVTFDDVSGLLAAQRQAAWQDVARRIAHEIKNPLTPIQLSAERLKRKYASAITKDRDVFERMTDTIVRQVTDIGRMVDEFSAFARMPEPKFAIDDLNDALRQAVFAQRIASPDIDVASSLPPEPVLVSMDIRLLTQVFVNILKNAAESISAERAASGNDTKGELSVTLTIEGSFAVIDVVDDGVGFPVQDRKRLLEPYMTTRSKGTGLGLAIVSKALEDHGGILDLADRQDNKRGARVHMRLPLAHAQPAHKTLSISYKTETSHGI